jgi:hypothetical protein
MKYEKDLLPVSNSAELQFSVRYGKRTEQQNSVAYDGLFCPGHDKPPIIQSKDVTISAKQFVYSQGNETVRGEGNIVLLDSQGVKRGKQIEFKVQNDIWAVWIK